MTVHNEHWSTAYIGQPWSEQQDCFYWFARIAREQFGVDVQSHLVDHARLVYSAARIMADPDAILHRYGYTPTDPAESPREGDAVFLSQRATPHHLGMVIRPGGTFAVLHALQGAGVIVSTRMGLKANGWRIHGFYRYVR